MHVRVCERARTRETEWHDSGCPCHKEPQWTPSLTSPSSHRLWKSRGNSEQRRRTATCSLLSCLLSPVIAANPEVSHLVSREAPVSVPCPQQALCWGRASPWLLRHRDEPSTEAVAHLELRPKMSHNPVSVTRSAARFRQPTPVTFTPRARASGLSTRQHPSNWPRQVAGRCVPVDRRSF